ncbi:type II secretion system protein [Candidatus Kaiserbacteria bacterium]|nr:type II secretion system protein [Candidatus Kaiserbacteria bacterium]
MHNLLRITKFPLRGFTLIELLVVIAIIGVLSAVVLTSLNSARSKGSDAAIKADLHNLQAQAELYYLGAGNYSYGTNASGCAAGMFADSVVAKQVAGAQSASGGTTAACYANGGSYLVGVKLASDATKWWCIDSTGAARQESGAFPASATYACP